MMYNIVSKLKTIKIKLLEDIFVHLVSKSISTQLNQFKVSYNC